MGTFASYFTKVVAADSPAAVTVEERILGGIARRREIRHGRSIFLAAWKSSTSCERELSIANGINCLANPAIWEVAL